MPDVLFHQVVVFLERQTQSMNESHTFYSLTDSFICFANITSASLHVFFLYIYFFDFFVFFVFLFLPRNIN